MTPGLVILLALKASLFLMVLAVGLRARTSDLAFLLHHPGLLTRSIVSMHVVMPLLVLWSALGFDLHPGVKVGLIALALSPMPPTLPNKTSRAGGDASYAVGLLTTTSILSIFMVPLALWVLGALIHVPIFLSPHAVFALIAAGVLVPLAVGVMIRRFRASFADRVAKPLSVVASVLLVLAIIPIIVDAWPSMRALIGNGTLVAVTLLTLVGLGVGHMLGGPDPDNRPVLALSTAVRHPAIAITISVAAIPSHALTPSAVVLAPAAVLLALIVGSIAAVPYVAWTKHRALERQRPPAASQQRRRSADVTAHEGTPAGFNAQGRGEHHS